MSPFSWHTPVGIVWFSQLLIKTRLPFWQWYLRQPVIWKNWLWGIWLPLTSHGCHSPIVGEGVGNCWMQKPELKTKPELQPQKGA